MFIQQVKKYIILIMVFLVGCAGVEEIDNSSHAKPSDKLLYAVQFAEGLSYDLRINTEMKYLAMERNSVMNTGLNCRLDVDSINQQGNAIVNCRIYRVTVKQRHYAQGETESIKKFDVDYDSSDKDKQTIPKLKGDDDYQFIYARGMQVYLDTQFSLKLTPGGRASEIIELEPSKLGRNRLAASLNITLFYPMAIYPETPVAVGDSWVVNDPMDQMAWENKCKLTDRKAGLAVIDVEMNMNIPGQDQFSRKYTGSVTMKEATGEIIQSNIVFKMPATQAQSAVAMETVFEMTIMDN